MWQRLLRAEQELEAEIKDVQAEANALAPEWGNTIFQSANEIIVNRLTKEKLLEKRAGLEAEKEAWEKVKEQSRAELEGETSNATSTTSTSTPEKVKPKAAAVTEASDEDTVLVEKTGDTNASGGGGKNKKKKGKK